MIFRGYGGAPVLLVAADDIGFPTGSPDEKEVLLQWLGYPGEPSCGIWTALTMPGPDLPQGKLTLLGILHHPTRVECGSMGVSATPR